MMLRSNTLRRLLLGTLVAVAGALVTTGASAAEGLSAAGATFPYPLYSKWFDVYQKQHGVSISYQAIGSGGGIRALTTGTVDIGASDAPLSDQEMKAMPGAVLHLPTVAGAVVVVYNVPGVGKGLRLTPDVLADIFLGSLKRWDDKRIASLNPGMKLPGTAIAVAHRSDGSGTSYIFTTYLAAVSRAWSVRVGAGKSVSWPLRLPAQPGGQVHRADAGLHPCRGGGSRKGDAAGRACLHRQLRERGGLPDRGLHLPAGLPQSARRRPREDGGGVPVVGRARRAEVRGEAAVRPPAGSGGGDRRGQDQVHDLRRACPAGGVVCLLSPWAGAFSKELWGRSRPPLFWWKRYNAGHRPKVVSQ